MRRPRGYTGRDHETIGSDILAVVRALQFPERLLGEETTKQLAALDPDGWYPIATLLEVMDQVAASGPYALRKVGRTLFKMSHEARVKQVAKSARDILYGIDAMYHHANRGVGIGGWKVLSFQPGRAELEKNTPHHCVMEEGILDAGLAAMGAPSLISQKSCFRDGAETCIYEVTSAVSDGRWGG